MAIKTAKELAAAAKAVAQNHKTLYVMGCFGAPMTASSKARYIRENSYNARAERKAKINAATADTFGFDCVCLIKGLLWGWDGDKNQVYGGATYKSNGVPDKDADQMIKLCRDVSTDFSTIQVGEVVWQPGHIGIYIGNGMAVESTPEEADGVQIQAVLPMGQIPGMAATGWTKHGKLPYVSYDAQEQAPVKQDPAPQPKPSTGVKALEVGDVVTFTGSVHYTNANAAAGKECKPGKATVTDKALDKKHPYHLKRTGSAGPYGWVDAADIAELSAPTLPQVPAVPEEVCNVELHVLRNGNKCASVKALQALLIAYGHSCGSKGTDGDFGDATESAVRAYQKAKGLTVDGVVGVKTWSKLLGR